MPFTPFDGEAFEGCSKLRAVAFCSTQLWSNADDYCFQHIFSLLEPKYIFISSAFVPGRLDGTTGDANLASVTHLSFAWYSDGDWWYEALRPFTSLSRVWIRIDMRRWHREVASNIRSSTAFLEARDIQVVITIHHYSMTARMALGLVKWYIDPLGLIDCFKISAEPDDGWKFDTEDWGEKFERHFSELET